MLYILWEYSVKRAHQRAFVRHYAASGTWAKFFRNSRGYRGSLLLRDREKPSRYITIDRWTSLAAYRRFRRKHEKSYDVLDKQFKRLTEKEACLGYFETDDQSR